MSKIWALEQINRLRAQYPEGTRIQVDSMENDPRPIPSGTKGTVLYVDDIGTIHCKFDNGRGLGLIPDEDKFHVIAQENVHERYPLLVGHAVDGNKRLHNMQEVAEFISWHGQYGDVRITTAENRLILKTNGIQIHEVRDAEYCEELRKVLETMQQEEPMEQEEETMTMGGM